MTGHLRGKPGERDATAATSDAQPTDEFVPDPHLSPLAASSLPAKSRGSRVTSLDPERIPAGVDGAPLPPRSRVRAPGVPGPRRGMIDASPPHLPPGSGSRLDQWWWARSRVTQRVIRIGSIALVLLTALVTRLWRLGDPRELVFDETFYVKDAWTLWNLGYESTWPDEINATFLTGGFAQFTTDPSFVVHPPLGKWLIGLGITAFGPENPFGWRIAVALAGVAIVVVVMMITLRLTGSRLVATIAGALMAIEGNAIVMSRVGLLDNLLALFALLGVAAVIMDRRGAFEHTRSWMLRREFSGRDPSWGPALWNRPWLIAAGVAFGAASAVKWSGIYFLAVLAVGSVIADMIDRQRLGIPHWISGTLLTQAPVSFVLMVPVAIAVHLSAWTGWFVTSGGYLRSWADDAGNAATGAFSALPTALQSWWHYMSVTYAYHVGEARPHPYEADAWTWLFLLRPTSMYWAGSDTLGPDACSSGECAAQITGIANPLIWWAAVAAIVWLIVMLIRGRVPSATAFVALGFGAGFVPWLAYPSRTIFQFYSIAFEPYLIIALAIALGALMGSTDQPRSTRAAAQWMVGGFIAIAVAISAYFFPIWIGLPMDYAFVASHWWLPGWR